MSYQVQQMINRYILKTGLFVLLLSIAACGSGGNDDGGKNPGGESPQPKQVFFTADDGIKGDALWKTNGTTEGTAIVMENPSNASSDPGGFLPIGDTVFFFAADGSGGRQIWKVSNNTTSRVTDLFPEGTPQLQFTLIELNGKAVFIASDGAASVSDQHLYITDGTETTLLAGGDSEATQIQLLNLTLVNSRLFYNELQNNVSTGLWATDGVDTVKIAEAPLSNWSVVLKDKFYYFVSVPVPDGNPALEIIELWETDGTPANTQLVQTFSTNTQGFVLRFSHVLDSIAYFSLLDDNGDRLWRFDGIENAVPLATINPTASANIAYFRNAAGKLYFMADDGTAGYEPWVFDPAAAAKPNPKMLADLTIDGDTNIRSTFTHTGDSLYFQYTTPAGYVTKRIIIADDSIVDTSFQGVTSSTPLNNNHYFIANDPQTGASLYQQNGTEILAVSSIWPFTQTASNFNIDIHEWNGALYFMVSSPDFGRELWTSDGTPAGTKIVKDIYPGPEGSWNGNRIGFQQTAMYFSAKDGVHGYELWRSDGTLSGTIMLDEINTQADTRGYDPSRIFYLNNKAYFFATPVCCDTYLYTTDGTQTGTVAVLNTRVLDPNHWVKDNKVVFEGYDPEFGEELFISDGTDQGTKLLKEFNPDGSTDFSYFVQPGEYWFFNAEYGTVDSLWRTDGTVEGTVMLGDQSISFTGSDRYYTAGQNLYKINSNVLYVLDGEFIQLSTNVGNQATALNGELYFSKNSGVDSGLWKTDGTLPGTQLVLTEDSADIYITLTDDTGFFYYEKFNETLNAYTTHKFDGDSHMQITGLPVNSYVSHGYSDKSHAFLFTESDTASPALWQLDNQGAASAIIELPSLDRLQTNGLAVFDDKLILGLETESKGVEPWVIDLSAQTIDLLKDVRAGVEGSDPRIGIANHD